MKHKVINIEPTVQDNVMEFIVHPGISNPGRCYKDADAARGDLQAEAICQATRKLTHPTTRILTPLVCEPVGCLERRP